ncbi:MurR/RpiR family transcriptional regulator [Alcaligenes endophyticus]|uniref:MurR/RpiR family transcriptional regulator n=1 Tax=Alcaligenes endophyticus TaxID=1929088 RepID=A0ABT8EF90_9BURK|nr:MurR/RpiR family transcriptional regulator [Alcaligenes endophyticus]MCX5590408.1 MurR/RpiR family transcriptional regulator [Alcaligenes endophyticus]MDN4119928.1 MurR/RpiR family transcriptional regulator [Alcaligenes endophyticus]
MNVTTSSFIQRVIEILPQLHPAEKRLAEFIRDFPGELASYSSLELAQLSEVSTATVSRFIRRLGYEGFEEAKRHMRANQDSALVRPLLRGRSATLSPVLAEHAGSLQQHVYDSYKDITPQQLQTMVAAVSEARKIWVAAVGLEQPLAHYLVGKLFAVQENVQLLPADDCGVALYLPRLQASDVVLVVAAGSSMSALPAYLGKLLGTAAQVVCISELTVLPMTLHSHWQAQAVADTSLPLPVLALCDVLLQQLSAVCKQ